MLRVLRSGLYLGACLSAFYCVGQSVGRELTSAPQGPTQFSPESSSSVLAASQNAAVLGSALKSPIISGNELREAFLFYRIGKLSAAIEKYRLTLRANPRSAEARAGLARIYLKQGHVGLASETVAEGLQSADTPDLRAALGEIYFRQGRISDAEREWMNVLNSGNQNSRAYLGLARIRNSLAQYGQGKALIDKARELDGIDPDIELNWNLGLPLTERIHLLEGYLASPEGVAAADRSNSERYLEYLKMLNLSPRGSCRLANPITPSEVALVPLLADAEHLRGYGLKVNVNRRKTTLLLDTGSSGILVSRRTAERAGIEKIAENQISGVGDDGAKNGYLGTAQSVKIGDLEFQDCPVRVLDQASVVEDEGVIGTDVFENFLVNVDFPGEKLRLNPLPPQPQDNGSEAELKKSNPFRDAFIAPEMRSYTHFYRFRHYLLVPTKIGDLAPKLFLLDTGGFTNQITPAAAREITHLHADRDKLVVGIDGRVKNVYSAEKVVLEFGRMRQENEDLVAFDLSPASESVGTEISGTLGFAALHRLDIKIDYRDALIDFSGPSGR